MVYVMDMALHKMKIIITTICVLQLSYAMLGSAISFVGIYVYLLFLYVRS